MAAVSFRIFLCWACLFVGFPCLLATEYVPVFMWESASDVKPIGVPALAKIHGTEFKDIVSEKLMHRDVVVVFVEENLSVEDFSWQDASGQSSYPRLQKVASDSDAMTYLPSVHSPLRVLRTLPGGRWQHVSLSPAGLEPDVDWDETGLLVVNLVDAAENEDRPHLLRRHDAFMTDMYEKLTKKHSKVTAMYTAHHPSWSDEGLSTSQDRSKREVNEGEFVNSTSLYNADNRTYLYTPTVPTLVINSKVINLGTPTKVITGNKTEDDLDVMEVEYVEAKLYFIFRTTTAGYWGLREVTAELPSENEQNPKYSLFGDVVEAPIGWSYHCSQSVMFKGTNKSETVLTFTSIQVQPLLPEAPPGEVPKFGESWDCTYFFTAPILSGFLIAILFAWIMGFGICMIMDIKTMDRFDDPKGKTINVNVSE